ncbi:hypothetical protein [uncultured Phascolarctobacterium sp.]|uniref:hypothetical protein n=1 Tax=uncultured Phascolarctobacterium sp. TaxID=512296 RepID=UPI0025D35F83|nr:hypothetical protein [uncultured Phascolarctobacterium sp.]
MRKIIITTIFILLSIASTCFAVNPLLLPDENSLLPLDTNRWKLFYININDFAIYADSENYTHIHEVLHDDCRMVDMWEWRVYFKTDSPDLFNDTYTISNVIYDFSCKTVSIKRIIEYDKAGNVLRDFSYSDSPKRIVPSSTGELVFKAMDYYDTHSINKK